MKKEDNLDLTSTFLTSLLFLSLGLLCIYFYNDTINNIKDIYNEERIIEISQGSFYGLFGSWVFISIFILLITVFLKKENYHIRKKACSLKL